MNYKQDILKGVVGIITGLVIGLLSFYMVRIARHGLHALEGEYRWSIGMGGDSSLYLGILVGVVVISPIFVFWRKWMKGQVSYLDGIIGGLLGCYIGYMLPIILFLLYVATGGYID